MIRAPVDPADAGPPELSPAILKEVIVNNCTVTVSGMTFSYGSASVFDRFGIQIPTGATGLLGPNGAGKTTLLTILATLAKPKDGMVEVLGHDVSDREQRKELRRRIGFMPQQFGLIGSFTVRESVEYSAWLHGTSGAACAEAANRALSLVDLAENADRKVRKLSGGMRQRLGIAQALAHNPDLLILDEPTVGLDPIQRMSFRHVLRRARERGSVLISSHMVDDIEQSCEQVVVLRKGTVMFTGTPLEIANIGEVYGDSTALGSPGERGYAKLVSSDERSGE